MRPAALVLVAATLAGACDPTPPPPVLPPGPTADEALARRAVDAAFHTLTTRHYSVSGCDAAAARLVAEAEVRAAPASSACSVRVARQRDRTWLVVVRGKAQPDMPTALVTVSPGGEGAQHIDYAY